VLTGPGPGLAADTVAGVWRVSDSLADADGEADGSVPAVFVWAALDCASYWAHRALGGEVFSALLAQLTAAVTGEVRVGGEYVVVARAEQVDGRKLWGSTAVYHPDGTLVGHSRALWIRLADDPG
jgi:hypothetical protein